MSSFQLFLPCLGYGLASIKKKCKTKLFVDYFDNRFAFVFQKHYLCGGESVFMLSSFFVFEAGFILKCKEQGCDLRHIGR